MIITNSLKGSHGVRVNNSYQMNVDFELNLADNSFVDNPKKKLIREEFEYLVWWLGHSQLHSKKYYSSEYFEYLNQFKLHSQQLFDQSFLPFWAKDPRNNKQRILNSKRHNSKLLNQLNINPRPFLVPTSMHELDQFEAPMWIRDEFSFSGSGTLAIREKSDLLYFKTKLRNKLEKIVIAPLLKPQEEFGVLVDLNGNYTIHRNIIDHAGQYKGSAFEYDFEASFSIDIHNKINQIITAYHPLSFDNWGIDFFKDANQNYHFCEMNHRKTMGLIGRLLWQKYFSDAKCFALFLLPQRTLNFVHDLQHLQKKISLSQVTIFSPLGNQYLLYGIYGSSLEQLLSLNEELKARILT
jgi:hypothetical protein